jgi:hypothetical protein
MASTRLSLRMSGPVDPARLALVARRGLGLSEGASARLMNALPLVVTVPLNAGPELDRIVAHLRGAGLNVEATPPVGRSSPCARHPRLAATEVCTRCGRNPACTACLQVEASIGCSQCQKGDGRRRNFRNVRVAMLLVVLVAVGSGAWLRKQRVTSWNGPLRVGVFPIRGDALPETEAFVHALSAASLDPVGAFLRDEGQRYGLRLSEPVDWHVGSEIAETPPAPPENPGALQAILWSLKFRYWSFRTLRVVDAPDVDVAVFLVFHSPGQRQSLDHSLGLEKAAAAVVHAFAHPRMVGSNQVVIAHELLHMLGATDKYDPQTGLPLFPEGYADPERSPVHPQGAAEIMGGRIPISPSQAKMPESLSECMVGAATAAEVGWTRASR